MEVDWQSVTAKLRNEQLPSLMVVSHPFTSIPPDVFEALSQSSNVNTVHIQMASMDDDDCKKLQLSGLPVELKSLYLSRNKITAAGLPAIAAAALSSTSNLLKLNLSVNPLKGDLAPLGRAVARSQLQALSLSDTQCRDGLIDFARALCDVDEGGACPLQLLELQSNGIDDDVAAGLVAPLAAAGVAELLLGKNAIEDAGAAAFASGCEATDARGLPNSPLRRLSLINNRLGDAAAIAFAQAVGASCPLHTLNLSHNRIGTAGVEALALAVRRNARLAAVDVGINPSASKASSTQLAALMEKGPQATRRFAAFRRVATLLLLANRSPPEAAAAAADSGGDLLAKLPHGVLLDILELARPVGFVVDTPPPPPPPQPPVDGAAAASAAVSIQ